MCILLHTLIQSKGTFLGFIVLVALTLPRQSIFKKGPQKVRFLGPRPQIHISRPWMGYIWKDNVNMKPQHLIGLNYLYQIKSHSVLKFQITRLLIFTVTIETVSRHKEKRCQFFFKVLSCWLGFYRTHKHEKHPNLSLKTHSRENWEKIRKKVKILTNSLIFTNMQMS